MKEAIELEPLTLCPFCSGTPRLLACHVYCTECFVAIAIFDTPQDAVRAWNQRAPVEQIQPELIPGARRYTVSRV
jgi:hypothetical protein